MLFPMESPRVMFGFSNPHNVDFIYCNITRLWIMGIFPFGFSHDDIRITITIYICAFKVVCNRIEVLPDDMLPPPLKITVLVPGKRRAVISPTVDNVRTFISIDVSDDPDTTNGRIDNGIRQEIVAL